MSSWYINPARWTAFIQGITAQQATLRLPWPARTCERIFIGSFSSAHTTAACVHAWRISSIRGVKQNRMEEELLWHSRQRKVASEAPATWFPPVLRLNLRNGKLLEPLVGCSLSTLLTALTPVHCARDYRKYSKSALAPKKKAVFE